MTDIKHYTEDGIEFWYAENYKVYWNIKNGEIFLM